MGGEEGKEENEKQSRLIRGQTVSLLFQYQITDSLFDSPMPFEAISTGEDVGLIGCLAIHNAIKNDQTTNKKLWCVISVTRPVSISEIQPSRVATCWVGLT